MNVPLDLVLLSYAGAGAAVFRDWPRHLPPGIRAVPLSLSGRGSRFSESTCRDWVSLTNDVACQAIGKIGSNYAIFGQSMGALVGLELAHALRRRTGHAPVWFGASACVAPRQRVRESRWASMPDREMVAELRRLGGMPPALLENTEFLDLVLPVIRTDFHLCGIYEPVARPPLDCPVLALGGRDDDVSAEPANLTAWREETSGPFRLDLIEGGHFFIETAREATIALIAADLLKRASQGAMRHG